MQSMNRFLRVLVPATLCGVIAVAAIRAQAQTEAAPGSLAGLTREVQQLRVAVEESTRAQSQIQMLSVMLSAQQSRLVQAANRLDATRRELAEAALHTSEANRLVKMFQGETAPEDREEAASLMKMFKPQADAAARHEQDLRAREAELLQAYQSEEARWMDLMARLDQSVKR
jgi:hypothetical protein